MLLNDEQTAEIVAITDDAITKELFVQLFGRTEERLTPRYQPNDAFFLKKGMISVYRETSALLTTIGRFIFNRFLNEGCFGTHFAYFNGEQADDFDKLVATELLEERLTLDQNSQYITKRSWLEYTPIELLVPGLSFNTIHPYPEVMKLKKELFKKYEKELREGNVTIGLEIEKALLDKANVCMKSDPAGRLFKLDKPKFGNHYKTMNVMIGPLESNTNRGEYHISKSNFCDGIDKDEYHHFADQVITGTYARSVDTQEGGVLMKRFSSAFQLEKVSSDRNSDCRTPYTLKVAITEDNIDSYLYSFVKVGSDLIEITSLNKKSFIGKTVNMRSPLFCADDIYCTKCVGTLFHRLGITNAGLTISAIGSKVQGLKMKMFHDTSMKLGEFNFASYFSDY
jgi:hypothetical protein